MNRSQLVGFGFIAAVAVAIALWLFIAEPSQPAPSSSSSSSSSSSAATSTTVEARATAQAQRLAQNAAQKRATRAAQATQLKQRLELVARAIDEAKQQPASPSASSASSSSSSSAGTLSREQVKAGVAEVKPQIVDCYEQALAQNPELAGTIQILFEIGEDPDDAASGAVVAGEVDSEMGSPFFEACVLQAVVGARFPRPEGGVVQVTYPFAFESRDADANADDAGP